MNDSNKFKEPSDLTAYMTMVIKSRAYRATSELINKELSELDITMVQWMALGLISNSKEGVTPSVISEQLGVNQAYTSNLLSMLLAKKLINEKPNPGDKRSKLYSISNSGSRLLNKSEKEVKKALKDWLSPIDEEKIRTYIEVLHEISYNPKIN